MSAIRKNLVKKWAKYFAAALIENAEPGQQEDTGLTEEEMKYAEEYLQILAKRIYKDDSSSMDD